MENLRVLNLQSKTLGEEACGGQGECPLAPGKLICRLLGSGGSLLGHSIACLLCFTYCLSHPSHGSYTPSGLFCSPTPFRSFVPSFSLHKRVRAALQKMKRPHPSPPQPPVATRVPSCRGSSTNTLGRKRKQATSTLLRSCFQMIFLPQGWS